MRADDLIHFCPPGRLIMACGARHQLPALLHRLGYQRGVFVTDRFFTGQTPWVDEYLRASADLGIRTVVFDGGLPDPTTVLCDHATALVRAQLGVAGADHVIALGGGSNIDLAKALALTIRQGDPIKRFIGDIGDCRPLPLVALPTTSGAGSEATPGAILIDPDSATKVAVMDNQLRPTIALIDPELSFTCPPRVTADAGIDAFTHAIESYLTLDSKDFDRGGSVDPGYSGRSGLTMLFAREAMRLCFAFLERAYRDGGDREARIGMAHASVYAALSYGSAGLNAVHGIAYAVAGRTHRSHGVTNAVMLPYVLQALRETRRAELLEVAALMGLRSGSDEAALDAVPRALRDLVGRLGIPTDLRSVGLDAADLDGLAGDALGVTRLAKALPVRDVPATYRAIVDDALHARLRG